MTARDRIVVLIIAALAILVGGWLLVVSPKREEASKLATQVSSAQSQLSTAESKLNEASAAQARYEADYTSLVRLGKAVPASQEVPSLIYQLALASNRKNVEFASITTGANGGSGSSSASSGAAATAATAGFTQMPFSFVFNGSFTDLYHLFQQLNRFTVRTASGGLRVSGRLLTIQSVKLAPASTGGSSGASNGQLSGAITATGYVLPAGQSLTGGATSGGPAGAAAPTASPSQTASTSSQGSSPTPAAVVKAGP